MQKAGARIPGGPSSGGKQIKGICQLFLFVFIFLVDFFILRERERASMQVRKGQREREKEGERERIPSRLHTTSAEPDAGLQLTNCEILT